MNTTALVGCGDVVREASSADQCILCFGGLETLGTALGPPYQEMSLLLNMLRLVTGRMTSIIPAAMLTLVVNAEVLPDYCCNILS